MRSALPLVLSSVAAVNAGCSSCDRTAAPTAPPVAASPPSRVFAFPSVPAPAEAETGRPILSRAAAFVPADAALVVVFRAWREAVSTLGLRAAFDTAVGRALLSRWNLAGVSLLDLPGLDRLGMDVDQSLVVAVLPGDVVMAVVAARDPAALAEVIGRAARGPAQVTTLQGREARSFEVGNARFTVVLHPAHLQVLIAPPETPPEVLDNQLQAGFDGAAVWVQRARAQPTPKGALAVAWSPGDGPPAPPVLPSPDTDWPELLDALETVWRAEASVAALTVDGDTVRLDVTAGVSNHTELVGRTADAQTPERLLAMLPGGPAFVAAARFSRHDVAVLTALARHLPDAPGAPARRSPDALVRALETAVLPSAFPVPRADVLRSAVFARYPAPTSGAGPGASLLVFDVGALDTPGEAVPALLTGLAGALGFAETAVTPATCAGSPCWRLATPLPLACAVAAPLLVCGLGDAPLDAALGLAREPFSAPPSAESALSLVHVEVPAEPTPTNAPAGLGALLDTLAREVRTATFTEHVGPERARFVLHVTGRGRPLLPALLPRLGDTVAPLLESAPPRE
jgi:hypothetical protein